MLFVYILYFGNPYNLIKKKIFNYRKKNKSFGTLKELLLFLTTCRSFFHCIQFEPFQRKSLKVWFFQGNPSIHAKVKRDDRAGQFWESQL